MPDLRRGFKTDAANLAAEERAELELGPLDALDPWILLAHHGITVVALSDLDGANATASAAVHHFMGSARGTFSALLLPVGLGAVVLENDSHARTRRTTNLAHELGHFLLEHDFGFARMVGGCRDVDPTVEEEALWLSSELLIPRPGALLCAREGMSDADVAEHYGVSTPFARMRMNRSGVRRQVRREESARGRQ